MITSIYRHQQGSSGRHEAGAIALVKHRGPENFRTELAKRMIGAVRSYAVNVKRTDLTRKLCTDLIRFRWARRPKSSGVDQPTHTVIRQHDWIA